MKRYDTTPFWNTILLSLLMVSTAAATHAQDKPQLTPNLDPMSLNRVFTVESTPQPNAAGGTACPSTTVSSPQGSPGPNGEYLVTEILDLHVETTLSSAQRVGDHLLRLRFETPSGHLYQWIDLPISSQPAPTARAVAGYPRALPVQTLAAEGPPTATATLPVAGTAIVHSSLYGTWTVTPYLDQATTPCGPAESFVLVALPTSSIPLFADDFESGDTGAWSLP